MARVVEIQGHFKVLETNRGVVVVNQYGVYENHAHFESLQAAKNCIDFIDRRLKPHSRYLTKAVIRLVGKESFDNFTDKPIKPKYRNRR